MTSYRAALDLAEAQGRADQRAVIALSLAARSEGHGQLDEAVAWCGRAAALAPEFGGWAVSAQLTRARLLLECYQPDTAIRALGNVELSRPVDRAAAARLQAKAYLLAGRAGAALTELDAATAAAQRLPDQARSAQLAETDQLRGVVLGELLAVEEAEECFLRAATLWSELGFSDWRGSPAT